MQYNNLKRELKLDYTNVSASYYLTNQREEGDLYSEEYTHVAVLFASIPDYMDSFRFGTKHDDVKFVFMIG